MVELDLSRLAPEVGSQLNMRGSLVPPLHWDDEACAPAKTRLVDMADDKLFAPHRPREREMLAGVRALLYLWNGHLDDAVKCVQTAPQKTQLYVQGLALRHQNKIDDAKVCFQRMEGYGTFPKLASATLELLENTQHPLLKRFADLLRFNTTWEPFAFADLYELALEGQLDRPTELVIRKIQAEEFNLLLVHAYRKATGQDPTRQTERPDPAAHRRRERQSSDRRSPGQTAETAAPRSEAPAKPAQDQKVRIACPKCRHVNTFAPEQRGRTVRCGKCAVSFAVPGGGGKSTAGAGVKVACPKCRVPDTYPAVKRGKTVQCKRCGAALVIPNAKSAA